MTMRILVVLSALAGTLGLGACEVARPFEQADPCVADADAGQKCSRIHGPGILDPKSPDFHVELLKSVRFDFDTCARCHGRGFEGGTSGKSCTGCHPRGPAACITCHQHLPEQGAHRAHLKGATVEHSEVCATCHNVPSAYDSPGHILDSSGAVDPPPAEVHFAPGIVGNFDPETKGCAVLCHGSLIPNTGAADPSPRWTEPHQEAGCGRCHGFPPTTIYHADSECQHCHPRVASKEEDILNPALHMDGKIDLGSDGSGRCQTCHALSTVDPVHQTHLFPRLRLSSNVACEACHLVPKTVTSTGHLDSLPPVEVFPEGQHSIAWSYGAQPHWERDTQTCSGTWCHGRDTSIVWRQYPTQVFCGTCHGVPPADAAHNAGMTVRDCATCHPSVDAYGNPKLVETATSVRSRHIDGKVDVQQ
ncbi:MAG: CxxxxCH/CxxCH domain-containing protein [Myxococcota bacterium]